ncbi:MAG: hypothetical protein ACREAI_05800, partial [Nitrososphaera sp.]
MPDYVLVASSQDLAGATMVECLKEKGFESEPPASYPNVKLHVTEASLLTLESLDDVYPDAKAFVFLSKHRSDSGKPT